jgi:hypothetical protein
MIVLLLVIALSGARAQDVRIGVRAGPTFGFLNDSAVPFVSATGDASANTNVRLDVHAGAFAIFSLSDRFSIQPELLFVQKGGHLSRPTLERYASERYRLSYVQGHLLGRRAFSLPGPLSMHIVGGVTIARAVGGAVQRDIRALEFTYDERIPLLQTRLIRRWDVGLLLGTGLSYPVGPASHVTLSVRYGPGFRTVFSKANRPAAARPAALGDPPPLQRLPPDLRHDVITASLSYAFPLSR